jgi:hypothetical protein
MMTPRKWCGEFFLKKNKKTMKIQFTKCFPNGKIIAMFERVYGYDITIVPLSECLEMAPKII